MGGLLCKKADDVGGFASTSGIAGGRRSTSDRMPRCAMRMVFRLGMALLPDRSMMLPLLRVANPNGERKSFVSRVPPVCTAVYLRFVRMPQCGRLRRAMLLALIQCLAARSTV